MRIVIDPFPCLPSVIRFRIRRLASDGTDCPHFAALRIQFSPLFFGEFLVRYELVHGKKPPYT